jgi:SAM-dependent methyltransferase
MKTLAKATYLVWAARHWPVADRSCPGCSWPATRLLKRKHVVTGLYQCGRCSLMFRVPKGSFDEDGVFYESNYEQGFTTELPDDSALEHLKNDSFRAIGKDISGSIEILKTLGVVSQGIIYDYGSSWGYASWQLRKHGYKVYSYDVAGTRAAYARDKLGCHSLAEASDVPEKVDCLFASHVLEHLVDPKVLWKTACDVLKPDGVVVLFVPNGEPIRERLHRQTYHQLWGRVHPLLLTTGALDWMARQYGFAGVGYSSPYQLGEIARGASGRLDGEELLFVARRRSA